MPGHSKLLALAASALLLAACSDDSEPPLSGRSRVLFGPAQGAGTSDSSSPHELELTGVGAGALELVGEAHATGTLTVELGVRDPFGDARVRSPASRELEVEPGPIRASIRLPDVGAAVLTVALDWTAADADARPPDFEQVVVHEERERETPPILFLSIDTLSARHLSLYGYPRATSPQLEAIAAESIVFRRCSANAPWTTPSYVSQFTGLYPEALRVEGEHDGPEEAEWNRWFLPDERWALAEALRAGGYRTAAFIDNPMVGSSFGFPQGFERWDESAFAFESDDPDGGIRHVMREGLAWLDAALARGDGEPWFLFLQALDVHGPYAPPDDARGRLGHDELYDPRRRELVARYPNQFEAVPKYVAETFSPEGRLAMELETAPIATAYDEEILALDAAVGELFDALRERGVLDRAVIVISADHGESMLEHGFFFAHNTIYEEVLHVPLLVRMPGGAGGGRWVDEGVQLVDLYPTLLSLASVPFDATRVHGRSLVPALEGGTLESRPALSSEGILRSSALLAGGWKLVEHDPDPNVEIRAFLSWPRVRDWIAERYPEIAAQPPDSAELAEALRSMPALAAAWEELRAALAVKHYELYDLDADPTESHDVSDSERETLARLLALLESERERGRKSRIDVESRSGFAPDAERSALLRALGYGGD